MRTLALALTGLAGAAVVAVAQPRDDATRAARAVDDALVFVPDGDLARIVATGFEEPLADLLWMRTVIVFGDRYGATVDPTLTEWVRRMVFAVTALDPTWRTPYLYGGAFARVSGDIDGSDAIYRRAMEKIPDDFWFPFAYGMNRYLFRDDPKGAADWIERASKLPGAPGWYAAAAAAMHQESGDRQAGIRFLEDLLKETTNPAIREDIDRQLRRLWHNEYVSRWEQACRDFRQRTGRNLADVAEFERVIGKLPPNPRADAWVVGGDGVVRSEGAEHERVMRLRREEWRLVTP